MAGFNSDNNHSLYVKSEEQAMRAVPQWVRDCWHEYSANTHRYPFGFSYHFEEAWNWKAGSAVLFSPEPLSSGGAGSTAARPRGQPEVDEVDPSVPPWE